MITHKEYNTYNGLSNNVVRSGITCLKAMLNTVEYNDELEMLAEADYLLEKVQRSLRLKHKSEFED